MKYIAAIFQGEKRVNESLSPGIYVVFERKKGPPDYGTEQIYLTEEQCRKALSAAKHDPNLTQEARTDLVWNLKYAFSKIEEMKIFLADPGGRKGEQPQLSSP